MTQTATLAARDLAAGYGVVPVLQNVSLSFAPATLTALLGPNGAGKSTLLKALSGVIAPTRGVVMLGDTPMATLPARQRAQRIGYFEQGARCHWNMPVAEVVALGRLPFETAPDVDARAVAEAMAATDVTTFATRPIHSLSGGEQARVLLARVLAGQPAWLLADEPLAQLDPAHQLAMLGLLRAHARPGLPQGGVVMVLHDLTLAARYADRIVLMHRGSIVADGPPADVLTPSNLANVYGIVADIRQDAHGLLVVPTGPVRTA